MPPPTPGKRHWYIPDAYLPSSGKGQTWEGHESACVLNVSKFDAVLTFTLYFEDREPIVIHEITVKHQSCRHIGMHKPEQLNGTVIPRDVPFGLAIESDVPIIVQYTRLDVTQPNFALMTALAYCEA